MKLVLITPLWYERSHSLTELVCKVEFFGFERRKRPRLWYSAPDITIQQLCDDVAQKFHAHRADFQPPLFSLSTREFHAADFF